MKRCLLTGIGGAIGIHVVAHIMENTDWEIVGIDSFNHHGHFDRLVELTKEHPDWLERIKVIRHDLCAPFTDREIAELGKIHYILNLASRVVVGESVDDPVPFVRNNVELQLQMLELARKLNPEVFLHFSTDETFGSAPKQTEGHKEWDPMIPSNPYAASKACQEVLATSYWRSYNLPLVITNCTNNFGEMAGPEKYSAIVQTKVNQGDVVTVHAAPDGELGTRYYIHSRNTADALLFILRNLPPYLHQPGESDRPDRYNVVGDWQVNNLELAQLIADLMGKELKYEVVNMLEYHPGHDMHYGLDGSKLAAKGWKAPETFEESLARTIEWQQNNPKWLG